MSDSLSRATGALYRRAWRQWVYAGAVLLGAAVGSFWGIPGVAAGVAVAIVLNFTLMLHLAVAITHARWEAICVGQLQLFVSALPAISAAAGGAWLSRYYGLPDFVVVGVSGTAAAAVAALMIAALPAAFGPDGAWAISLVTSRLGKLSARKGRKP